MLTVFEDILKIGRFWVGDKILEIKDPKADRFQANRSTDPMWVRVILRSAQSEGGLESATAKGAWLDEAGQDEFQVEAWRAIKRRLSLSRGRVLLTSTLYNLGWIKSEFIDKADKNGVLVTSEAPAGGAVDFTDSKKDDVALIQFDSIVNPEFSKVEYEEAERDSPPDQFAMFYRGRVARPRHMIYDCLDEDVHFIPRFTIPNEWRRYVGLDFGGVNTAATFWAQDPLSSFLYCYREYFDGKKSADEHVDDMLKGETERPVCYGGSKSEGQWRMEFRKAGLPVKDPKISEVWLGINKVYSAFKKKEVFIFDDLPRIKYDLLNYRRKTDENGEPTDEIVEKNRFHMADNCRYIIASVKRERRVLIAVA